LERHGVHKLLSSGNTVGRVSFVHNQTDSNFDRSYSYDHAGRLTCAPSGGAARQDVGDVPYYETYAYDSWGNTTSRFTETWVEQDFYDSATYSNNRRNGWGYNADGQIQSIDTRSYNYDAAGRNVLVTGQVWGGSGYGYYSTSTANTSDGDGQKVKEVSTSPFSSLTTHYLRSSVLGGAILQEINTAGQTTGYVYTPNRELLTRQLGYPAWKYVTPVGTSQYLTYQEAWLGTGRTEFDPDGADVALTAPPPYGGGGEGDLENHSGTPTDSRFSDIANLGAGCMDLDGIEMPCGAPVNSGQGSLSWLYVFYQSKSLIGYRNKGVLGVQHSTLATMQIGVFKAYIGESSTLAVKM